MDGIQVRFAEPRDAPQIADLFSRGFRADVAQLLVYGCRGASEYIRMQLASAVSTAESAYFVAQTANGIIGAAELRRQPDRLFLNYIAMDPSHRGQGVGAILLLAAVGMSGVSSGQIGLDVLHDNVRAQQWYCSLGFVTRTSTEFLEIAPPGGADVGAAYVSGLAQADLCQGRFGFSKFNLVTKKGTFSVGRIGDTWFRLTDLPALWDPEVFAALNLLDPGRRIFAVVPASSVSPAQVVRLLAKTHRMEAGIQHVMAFLSDDCQKSREHV
jgi:ribosomal protein S18 acetylase RimI-like enzyme